MAAKQIIYHEDARQALLRGVNSWRRGQGDSRPEGTQRRPRQEVRIPHHHQGRRHGREGDRPEGPAREPRARMVREVASKTSDLAGDGTTTATVLAQAIVREGSKNVAAGATRWA